MASCDARVIRAELAQASGLDDPKDVRCYHCARWGYNCGKVMDSMGQSRCTIRKGEDAKTASYQFCRKFNYVGNGK